MQDDKDLISRNTSKQLKKNLLNGLYLQSRFRSFMVNETNCRDNIAETMDIFTKIIVKNTLAVSSNNLDELKLDELVNIADTYANIQALIQNCFAAGLMYGKAQFNQDFQENFTELKSESFMELIEKFLERHDPEVPRIDISDFTDFYQDPDSDEFGEYGNYDDYF
jgi:hypothetical protein